MIIDYNKSQNITEEERLSSLRDSVQRALDEAAKTINEAVDIQKQNLTEKIDTTTQTVAVVRKTAHKAYSTADEAMQGVDDLQTRVAAAEEEITEVEGNISDLEERVETAEGKVEGIEEDVSGLQDRVETAEGSITEVEGDITSLQGRVSAAEGDITDVEQGLVQARQDIQDAAASAQNASEYAARALGNLSTVQSVTETLNWITQHGTMDPTSDQALDPSHVYFVLNDPPSGQTEPHGDYYVSGHYYDVVTEPDVADIATYYELSINESLNNYVATHLAVDSEGLWIIPDAGGNKVLIATGQGSTYTSAGTYIVSGNSGAVAQFLSDGERIGRSTESHLEMDYHSFKMIDKNGNTYFWVSDLRDSDGWYYYSVEHTGDGAKRQFSAGFKSLNPSSEIYEIESVFVDDVDVHNWTVSSSSIPPHITFDTAPANGSHIVINAKCDSYLLKAYTVGQRNTNSKVGNYSVAIGLGGTASGDRAIACGPSEASGILSFSESGSIASGIYSHAEANAEASGNHSHAQNQHTIAASYAQTALGKYNISDNADAYSVIIGNGTSDNARSNALTVDWDGKVQCGDYSGNFKSIFDIFYPVGSYYETSDSTFDPNVAWGGTWSLETAGKFHVSAGTGYAIGSTGGSASVTLDINQIPNHNHSVGLNAGGSSYGSGLSYLTNYSYRKYADSGEMIAKVGGGQSHENRPPYVAVNRWHRTA